MTYDQYKQDSNESPENECGFCGNSCNGTFCNDYCETGDISENCRD